jgi:hypothetical protein
MKVLFTLVAIVFAAIGVVKMGRLIDLRDCTFEDAAYSGIVGWLWFCGGIIILALVVNAL